MKIIKTVFVILILLLTCLCIVGVVTIFVVGPEIHLAENSFFGIYPMDLDLVKLVIMAAVIAIFAIVTLFVLEYLPEVS